MTIPRRVRVRMPRLQVVRRLSSGVFSRYQRALDSMEKA
jgi:hypothetical protein